jgi:hypothetical protein
MLKSKRRQTVTNAAFMLVHRLTAFSQPLCFQLNSWCIPAALSKVISHTYASGYDRECRILVGEVMEIVCLKDRKEKGE